MRGIPTILACAILLAAAPLAGAEHGDRDDHGDHGASDGAAETVRAAAVVHAIAGDTVNLTHDPIPEIGWPAMTMDLPILEGAHIGGVAPGDKATVTLEKGPDGLYGVRMLMRAE